MPDACQPDRQRRREGRLADDAAEHADGGDADLHRRQETASGPPSAAAPRRRRCRPSRPAPRAAPRGWWPAPFRTLRTTPLSSVSKREQQDIHGSRERMGTMALYLIGDVQGCDAPLRRPARQDRLLPQPRHAGAAGRPGQPRPRLRLAVLRRLQRLGGAGALPAGQPRPAPAGAWPHGAAQAAPQATRWTTCCGARPRRRCSTGCATSPWRCIGASAGSDLLMVHAGVLPQWNVGADAGAGGRSRGRAARPATCGDFLQQMYGNEPDALERRAAAATTACA